MPRGSVHHPLNAYCFTAFLADIGAHRGEAWKHIQHAAMRTVLAGHFLPHRQRQPTHRCLQLVQWNRLDHRIAFGWLAGWLAGAPYIFVKMEPRAKYQRYMNANWVGLDHKRKLSPRFAAKMHLAQCPCAMGHFAKLRDIYDLPLNFWRIFL